MQKQKADPRHGSGSAVKLFQQAELLHGSLQLCLHCGGGRNERQTAVAGIPAKAVAALAALDVRAGRAVDPSEYNAYVGPHIGAECYECGPDLVGRFVERFGASCARGADHLDLEAAVRASLAEAGIAPERIASSGECTACRDALYEVSTLKPAGGKPMPAEAFWNGYCRAANKDGCGRAVSPSLG